MALEADEIKRLLGLTRHPTCGFVAETYRSSRTIPAGAMPAPYEGERPWGSALYFLVTPDAQIVLHRIRQDQLYHHYLGDPLDGRGDVVTIGSDLAAGMRPQLLIPGGTFHMSRLRPGARWALLASTEWPGVEPPDVEHGDAPALERAYPAMQALIREFVGASTHQ